MKVARAVVIFNPVSGKGKAKRVLEQIAMPRFKEAGIDVEVHATERSGHAIELGPGGRAEAGPPAQRGTTSTGTSTVAALLEAPATPPGRRTPEK